MCAGRDRRDDGVRWRHEHFSHICADYPACGAADFNRAARGCRNRHAVADRDDDARASDTDQRAGGDAISYSDYNADGNASADAHSHTSGDADGDSYAGGV